MKSDMMEAVVFDAVNLKLQYVTNYPKPKIQDDTDVIIKVAYSGLCGTDLHIIQGEFPCSKERPLPLGHESSGVIHEAGPKSHFKVGQKVVIDPNCPCNACEYCHAGNYHYCLTSGNHGVIGILKDGGWAQYVRVPQAQVHLMPDNVTLEQGGLCEPYSCVAQGFKRIGTLLIGSKILIIGAGIIGNLWITSLHHQGHRNVTVTEMNKNRLEIVKRINTGYRLVTPDVLQQNPEEFDLIIDCTGVGKVMEINVKFLRNGGRYVLFGCCPPTHTATVNPFNIYLKELSIIGVKINPFTFPTALGWLSAMGDRYINYENLGIKTYKLSEYEEAIECLRKGEISKAIFKVE